MSLHRSMGDLVPQDIAEILARERHGVKGRKHRGGSLGRAFRWLKARRKKKRAAGGSTNGMTGLSGDGRAGKHSHQHGHDIAKGLLKQEEESRPCLSPLYPENVFIDGNRPQFLQDLHTEAQEGLKIQQQEENGMDYQDDESVVSTVTLQTGDDCSLADSMRTVGSGDTATDAMSTVSGVSAVSVVSGVSTVSAASTVSTRSSRSGLTRQGSTFKPISGSKRPERTRRRSKRATVAGIPQHVKRELGLDRGPWQTQVSPTEGPLPNGEGVVMLMEEEEVDAGGTPESVREHLELLEVLEAAEEQQLQRHHLQALYRDDLAVARSAGPRLSPRRRPRSVLVPGVIPKAPAPLPAAAGSPSEAFPPSPVMYVSPQATYLSKIIPNAVLPGDVDVIEISRKGRSRGSVRTLSRSSLAAPSPALSRASSDSDSSHTVVSDSSTISSGGGRGRGRKASQEAGRGEGMPSPTSPTSLMSPDQLSLHSSISCSSNITSVSQQGWDGQGHGPFGRSLSVKKAKKNPPAPPRRTNSLHPSKLRRRSRDAQLDGPAQSSSPAYSADQSQISSSSSSSSSSAVAGLPAPVQSNGIDRTLSPSSGYGSQNPTPAVSPYSIYPQAVQKGAPLTRPKTSAPLLITSAILAFGAPPEVPPHPRVKAPTPPPPETWIHDQRSFDLLIGPSAVQRNLFVALQKVRLDRQRRPLVAGGVQKKEPPPVMKKSGFVKTEVLRHAGPTPAPSHNPPPPSSVSGPQHPSESDSAWPLPPPPPVELLPGSVFDGQDETDLLPPPPLQDGAGSPPVPPDICPAPPVATTLLIMATPTPVTMETTPPAVHAHQQTQDVPAPATIVTAPMTTMPSDTAKPGSPAPQSSRRNKSLELPPLVKEVPPRAQETLYLLQGIPPPPKKPPPPPPEAPPALQHAPPPTQEATPPPTEAQFVQLEIPPPPKEAPPPPPEATIVPQEVPAPTPEAPSPPKEAPPELLKVLPPSQEVPPVLQEASPPPTEAPFVLQEIPPPPKEAPPPPPEVLPAPQEVPPAPQEVPPAPQEVPPAPQEVPPAPQEVPPAPQEVPPAPLEVTPAPLEVTPAPQEVPPAPQEVPPAPLEVTPAPQEVTPAPLEVTPAPLEVTPAPLEVTPAPQEVPPVAQEVTPAPLEVTPAPLEVTPAPQEVPPVAQEVLLPPQEAPPVLQEVKAPPQEASPIPEEVLPPPQEVASVPQEVLPPPQEVEPVPPEVLPPPQEVTPVPQEVQTSVLAVPTVAPPPPPVEEQTPPTCPADSGPANQEAPSVEPQPKSSPTPKRDARVPMTTSALLQLVRMRSSEPRDTGEQPGQNQNQNQADGQSAVQRPETLPLTAPPPAVKYPPPSTGPAPSMRLQEAIRMKTAAMSRVGSRSPRSPSPSPSSPSPSSPSPSPSSPSPSSPSTACTASFIFAKSSRKVVIETPSSPKVRAGLKAHLAAELARVSAPAKTAKVPPPVAKKPGQSAPADQEPPVAPATEAQQRRDGLTPAVAGNGGENTPQATETPTEREQTKENGESPDARPGGAQSPNTEQMSLSPPP